MSYPAPPSGSPYPPAQGYGAPPKRLRGRTPLRLALIFGVIGLALTIIGGVVIAKKSYDKVNGFSRVNLSSTGTAHFSSAGNYVAYYEARDVDSSTKEVPRIPVAMQSPSGKIIQLSTPYGGRPDGKVKIVTYQYDGHNGIALWQFKITEKGTYKVEVGSNTLASSGADIAFGVSIAAGTAVGAGLIVPGVLLIIAAIVLLIVGLVKRSRHKKELASGFYPGGPPPGQQWAPQQPPQQQWPQQPPQQQWPQQPPQQQWPQQPPQPGQGRPQQPG